MKNCCCCFQRTNRTYFFKGRKYFAEQYLQYKTIYKTLPKYDESGLLKTLNFCKKTPFK